MAAGRKKILYEYITDGGFLCLDANWLEGSVEHDYAFAMTLRFPQDPKFKFFSDICFKNPEGQYFELDTLQRLQIQRSLFEELLEKKYKLTTITPIFDEVCEELRKELKRLKHKEEITAAIRCVKELEGKLPGLKSKEMLKKEIGLANLRARLMLKEKIEPGKKRLTPKEKIVERKPEDEKPSVSKGSLASKVVIARVLNRCGKNEDEGLLRHVRELQRLKRVSSVVNECKNYYKEYIEYINKKDELARQEEEAASSPKVDSEPVTVTPRP